MSRKQAKPCVAVSSCLLGQLVRYDGRHKRNDYISDSLAIHFQLIPLCPEVAIGLGIPRPPIQLVLGSPHIRVVEINNPGHDLTRPLQDYARDVARNHSDLCGYIFKSRSPSCGLNDTPVFDGRQITGRPESGIYTATLTRALPALPVATESDLEGLEKRQKFIDQVFCYQQQLSTTHSGAGRAPGLES